MDILNQILNSLPMVFTVFLRTSGMLTSAPIFSSRNIPAQIKIFFAIILSLIIVLIFPSNNNLPQFGLALVVIFIGEFLVGMVIGYASNLIFAAIQLAGQSIDMQMGFGIVNIMDPQTGIQIPLMGTFKYLLATLVFFAIDGHHLLIEALFYSYQVVPLGGLQISSSLASLLIGLTAKMFLVAFKLAAPLVGAIFITDFTMGIISRTVPQMNVFLVGMPAKIVSGFLLMLMVLPFYIYLLSSLFEQSLKDLMGLLRVLS